MKVLPHVKMLKAAILKKNGRQLVFVKNLVLKITNYEAKKTAVFSDSWLGHYFYFKLNKKS